MKECQCSGCIKFLFGIFAKKVFSHLQVTIFEGPEGPVNYQVQAPVWAHLDRIHGYALPKAYWNYLGPRNESDKQRKKVDMTPLSPYNQIYAAICKVNSKTWTGFIKTTKLRRLINFFQTRFHTKGEIDEEQRVSILRSQKSCSLHRDAI